jgi:molybdopterin/thiamine biosynthesis adenylyltransferase
MASRYARQLILPQIGEQGQKKLGKKKVLIAGIGGLGSVLSLYLAAAGIGQILIVDNDEVDISNLNRQIIHGEAFLGHPKVISAEKRLTDFNSSVKIIIKQERLTEDNIDSLVTGVDAILDGSDNYVTRQVLNRASIRYNIPFIFGGVKGFDGMVSAFIPGLTACFECIFSSPKSQKDHPHGVIGPTAGITGSIQAMEAIKVLLGIGGTLQNRLLRFSGFDMNFSTTNLIRKPDCHACGSL